MRDLDSTRISNANRVTFTGFKIILILQIRINFNPVQIGNFQ